MKKFVLVLFWLFLLYTVSAQETKIVYTCSMHPEIQMDNPGKCPKCGMALIKKTINQATAKPGIQKDQPKENNQRVTRQKSTTLYTCVTHPGIVSSKPGKCSLCGIALFKKTINYALALPGAKSMGIVDTTAFVEAGNKLMLTQGKTIVYHLYVTDTIVNFTGNKKHAIAINGSIPAPTLTFTEGDTAEIYLHNQLKKEETSLHWHGVILPNRFDGVPYLTTARIAPGQTHLYKFRVVQNGTYWYHSHSGLQEQQGMYGALIFKKREQEKLTRTVGTKDSLAHYTVVLSEWSDEDPDQTQRRFRSANDWYAIKKGSTQSYSEAIKEGYVKTKLLNEWKRMKAMDVSDNWYQRFLVNGKPGLAQDQFSAGQRVVLHVVNAGASTYFWLGYAAGKITVVGNDGNEVEPTVVDRLIIAPSETYDLIVTVPGNMAYEFRATAEDRTGASSLWLGRGTKVAAPQLPRLKYFEGMKMMNGMMRTNGTMDDMGMNMSMQQMDMNTVMYPEITGDINAHIALPKKDTMSEIISLNYAMLKAPFNTALPGAAMKTLHFSLTGNMNRYVWTLDNKTVGEADRILIRKGENVRLILTNNSMMRHPMHLHGHDFRVINGQGDYAPLKNVLDIMPMETDTIEFAANQDGDWFFHCHILFHMMAGMGRVFTYENSMPNPELPDSKKASRLFKKDNRMVHAMAMVGLESNGSDGEAMISTDRYALITEWRIGSKPHHGHESETYLGRYFGVNQWLFPYVGFDYHKNETMNETEKNLFGQLSNQDNRQTFTVGLRYTLPWLMVGDTRIDGEGKFRLQLNREDIPLTPRLRLNILGNSDREYMLGLRYVIRKWFALSTHYDSDMGYGAGLTFTY